MIKLIKKVEFNTNLLSQTKEYKSLQSFSVSKAELKNISKKLRDYIFDGYLVGNTEILSIMFSLKQIDKDCDINFYKTKFINGLNNKDFSIISYLLKELKQKDLWQYFSVRECEEIEDILKYSKLSNSSQKNWE